MNHQSFHGSSPSAEERETGLADRWLNVAVLVGLLLVGEQASGVHDEIPDRDAVRSLRGDDEVTN
jgi:hypothetical protein